MKKKFKVPKFANEAQERVFWAKIDLAKFFVPHDFWSLSGALQSKIKLSDKKLRHARKTFESKWPRKI